MFTGGYFKGDDLEKPKLLTIESVGKEELGEGKEERWVVRFAEDDRGCVLNKTRAEEIVDATGRDDSDEWLGCKLVLYKGQTRFQGKMVACVAIRAPKKQAKAKPEPEEPVDEFGDDDIPF